MKSLSYSWLLQVVMVVTCFVAVAQATCKLDIDDDGKTLPLTDGDIGALFTQEWRDYVNFFLPTLKLVKKEYIGTRTRRFYEPVARTPYQRLMASKHGVSRKSKAALKAHFERLDPFALKIQLDAKLREILNNARCPEL